MSRLEPLKIGERIGDLQVEKLLARGGQSFVYRASTQSGDSFVLKELAPMTKAQRTGGAKLDWIKDNTPYFSEWHTHFDLSRRVDHSAIYQFNRLFESNNTLYLVGDYVPGQSLFEHLNQICFEKHMPQARLIRLMLPVIQGLNYLHKNGMFHGDIKPANLFITLENKVLLLDGINNGSVRLDYSEGFSAPEITNTKSADKQSDYFSLGVLLAYLMTGCKVPVDAKLDRQLPYDNELLAFIESCIVALPEQRPRNLKRLVDIFKRLQSQSNESPIDIDVPTVKLPRSNAQPERKLFLPFAATIFSALLVPIIWLSWPDTDRETNEQPIAVMEGTVDELNSHHEIEPQGTIESKGAFEPQGAIEQKLAPAEAPLEPEGKLRNVPLSGMETTELAISDEVIMESRPRLIQTLLDNMVSFPAGEFWLGSSNGKAAEKPVSKVSVSAFKLLNHEVTYALYSKCVEQKRCRAPNRQADYNQPVSGVSFEDIKQQFIPWLNELSDVTFRLPSEIEWEYSAKFGVGEGFAWGSEVLPDAANCRDCSSDYAGRKSAPVKSFQASKAGLFDMNGNVEEWVDDCWRPSHDSEAISGCTQITVKGGSWDSRLGAIRNSARRGEDRNRRSSGLGFRLALSD